MSIYNSRVYVRVVVDTPLVPFSPWVFRQAREPKQKIAIDNPKDVVHENPYAALEHALTSFISSVA